MLRRLPVIDLSNGKVSRSESYIVIAMRHYPRYTPKELSDEYVRALAPEAELFDEFKERERKTKNHNGAFYSVDYEKRFWLGEEGLAHLARLSEMSRERDVVLICQCRDYDRCHCDLLLLMARAKFGAEIKAPLFEYPNFLARL